MLLESGRLELDWLVTHRLPLSEAGHAVELLTGDAAKVLLVPDLAESDGQPRGTGTDAG